MPLLTFTTAVPTNPDSDGLDVLFYYKTHDSLIRQKIHLVGSATSRNMTAEEKIAYMQRLFTSAVAYIKAYWNRHHKLPDEQTEVHQGVDFTLQTDQKTAWKGYTLDLM
ncbi:hypothetical protein GO730_17295 [Spirosoma sp. HMF3257]|uniref:Uncharacterized protein n=1 Tax=Spirosoma telluris TaxID=2183553 RepID=A0A327NL36_9BACT|nr:hypothetical protein [Spirosoma telluris]RAI75473.1 hypothetical protein HMF3257_17225 [Spirosoma telluris]